MEKFLRQNRSSRSTTWSIHQTVLSQIRLNLYLALPAMEFHWPLDSPKWYLCQVIYSSNLSPKQPHSHHCLTYFRRCVLVYVGNVCVHHQCCCAMNFLPGNVVFHLVLHLTGMLAWCVLSVYICNTVHLWTIRQEYVHSVHIWSMVFDTVSCFA